MHEKLLAIAKFVVGNLGLHYPRELTSASIVGVAIAAHGKPVTYQQAHKYHEMFKDNVKDERKGTIVDPRPCHIPTLGRRIHGAVARPLCSW